MLINVNWSKIKPFEKKGFALGASIGLGVIALGLIIGGFAINGVNEALKLVASIICVIITGLLIHIESRMLQIYMLGGVLDLFLALSLIKSGGIAFIIISAVLCVLLLIALTAVKGYILKGTEYSSPEPDRSSIYAGKNVMMFAPHEDDEINIYGGIIEQYVKYGSSVKVVFSTNGDVYGIGKTRIKEALKVAKSYGLSDDDFIFLGYSDSMRGADGKHIYNCSDDEAVTSVKGYTNAYGIDSHNSFSNKSYTRQNVVDDFKDVIMKHQPDTIYCCDYDSHPDHRAIGLFFEEALGEILKENSLYSPKVYKGFAYSLAWMGKLDYYSLNSLSTHQWVVDDMMVENNAYRWDERLRLPVSKSSLSRIMQNASSYKAMMEYSSQTATDHANGILNNDKVFWERRTDSVLYNAKITATSGDASKLCDFKLIDSTDINDGKLMPKASAWVCDKDDSNRIVFAELGAKKCINEVVIWASQEPENKVLNATVKIGEHQFDTGELKLGANSFAVPSVEADKLAVRIDSFEGEASILKLEAFEVATNKSAQVVKLVNSNDDFCYDYFIDNFGSESFNLYTYPANATDSFEFEASGDIEFDFEDESIVIRCKENESGVLTIRSRDNSLVYDEVKLSNPNEATRLELERKQLLEQKLWTIPMQADYYIGLVRRLGVYLKPQ